MPKICHASGICSFALLLSLGVFVGCGKDAPVEAKKKATVRVQIKDNFKSAFESIAKESQTPAAQTLQSALSSVLRLVGSDSAANSLNSAALKDMIEKLFESELAKAIFAESNITSQTDSQVIYAMKPSMCEKLGPMAASEAELIIKGCQDFLAKNDLEFRVNQLDNNETELSMWHGAVVNGSSNKQLVGSLKTSPNSLSGRFNLAGSKELLEALMGLMPQDPVATAPLVLVKKLAGALSLELRFRSASGESGCKDKSTLCVVGNVDEDVDVEVEGDTSLKVSIGKSPIDNPSGMVSVSQDNTFKGNFNFGALDIKVTNPNISASMEKAQFGVSMTNSKDGMAFMLENFKAGKNPSFFEGFGKKVVVDLANDSRMIEKIRVSIEAAKILIDLSPFALLLSLGDDSNGQCKTFESFKLATSASEPTQLSFLGMPGMRPYANNLHFYKKSCTESSLMAFPFVSMFKVTNEHCDMPVSLSVNQGSLELTYSYHLNGGSDQSKVLSASVGQCLRI